jgi:hypothetical protein
MRGKAVAVCLGGRVIDSDRDGGDLQGRFIR